MTIRAIFLSNNCVNVYSNICNKYFISYNILKILNSVYFDNWELTN